MLEPIAKPDDLPCPECPEEHLSKFLVSPAGQIISIALNVDHAITLGISVALADVSYIEFLLLRQLAEERENWRVEEINKRRS